MPLPLSRAAARGGARTGFRTAFRAAARALATALACACALSGCQPARQHNLRVEAQETAQAPTAASTAQAGRADRPYSAARLRTAILAESRLADQAGYDQAGEVLRSCEDCLELRTPLRIGSEKFQLAALTAPSEDQPFAAFVVADQSDRPAVKLFVTGHDLTVSPGQGGTLVAQESLYRKGDPRCCPSGWSVRVYRYHSGRFEAGQRISRDTTG